MFFCFAIWQIWKLTRNSACKQVSHLFLLCSFKKCFRQYDYLFRLSKCYCDQIFCPWNFRFFIAILFLFLSDIGLRSTVKVKEFPAWGHYHQASCLYVENLLPFPYDREECRRHLGLFPRVKRHLSTRISNFANSSQGPLLNKHVSNSLIYALLSQLHVASIVFQLVFYE